MGVFQLLLLLAFLSLITWIVITYIVKGEPFRTIAVAVAALIAIYILMSAFGIVDIPLPRAR